MWRCGCVSDGLAQSPEAHRPDWSGEGGSEIEKGEHEGDRSSYSLLLCCRVRRFHSMGVRVLYARG